MKMLVPLPNKSFNGLYNPLKGFDWYKLGYFIVDYTFEGTP